MSTSQPIRKVEEIEALKHYFLYAKPSLRNYAMVCLGINSALRISDLLSLDWADVYNFAEGRFLTHISTIEQKTGKPTQIALNRNALEALTVYKDSLPDLKKTDCLFPGRNGHKPLSRSQAFRLLQSAGQALHFEHEISCHTLRKTFGYHAWRAGVHPVVLMNIFNHSSFQVTKRYLGIEQDDKDQVFLDVNL